MNNLGKEDSCFLLKFLAIFNSVYGLSGEVLSSKVAIATYGYLNVSKIEIHLFSSTSHMWLGPAILDNI